MSHSPLLGRVDLAPSDAKDLNEAIEQARDLVRAFDPTLVVAFAPDHYNGFFHDLMPPFCVGLGARGVGDYGSAAGPLDVPSSKAEDLVEHLIGKDLDVAFSRRMDIDHGAVQPLELLLGGIDSVPTIPVFVNGVARPYTRMARVGLLGRSVGQFVANLPAERVLILGSGGLSHDPPVPQWARANEDQREALLDGRTPSADARRAREARVFEAARAFVSGDSTMRDLNPEWDLSLMRKLMAGDLDSIDLMQADQMEREAGASAHEVRTWVAAFNAMAATGPYSVDLHFYRPLRELIAGFGVVVATPTVEAEGVDQTQVDGFGVVAGSTSGTAPNGAE